MIPKILLLVKQIRPRTAQIDNLRAPIPIFFQPRALEAVEGVRDALIRSTLTSSSASVASTYRVKKGEKGEKKFTHLPAAHDALVLIIAKGAFVADADEGRGAHVAVADGAFAVAFVAEAADGDAGLLAAHY